MKDFTTEDAQKLKESGELSPECGEEFDISVSYSMKVQKCGKVTGNESTKMFNGLMREWDRKTYAICSQLSECDEPKIINYEPDQDGSTCENNLWTMTAIVTTKCGTL